MNLSSLQALTWSTVAAAVASALTLAAVEPPAGLSGAVVIGSQRALPPPLPTEPTAAGPAPQAAASAVVTGPLEGQPSAGGL